MSKGLLWTFGSYHSSQCARRSWHVGNGVTRIAPGVLSQALAIRADVTSDQPGGPQDTFRVDIADVASSGARLRLDAFLAASLPAASRARLQEAIKQGAVTVNGAKVGKTALALRAGDIICCSMPAPTPVETLPEAIPLDIMYEDEYLIVINKAAGMVVHPSPGHWGGTLVNALLAHCGLPAMRICPDGASPSALSWPDDSDSDMLDSDSEIAADEPPSSLAGVRTDVPGVMRPGIVHRLDKGTSGLMVVAKDDSTLTALSDQFRQRTVEREYLAVNLGVPAEPSGTVRTNLVRDPADRKRITTAAYLSTRGRHAVSNYGVVEPLAGGTAALMRWQLQTGRTHQIRVHAKYKGHPIFADETYGGAGGSAVNAIGRGKSSRQARVNQLLKALGRPALHARTLGFVHPATGQTLRFTTVLPPDMEACVAGLRDLSF